MAATVAGVLLALVVSTILGNLNTLLAFGEFPTAWGFKTELKNLESTLAMIQAVLQDAKEQQWNSETMKSWLRTLFVVNSWIMWFIFSSFLRIRCCHEFASLSGGVRHLAMMESLIRVECLKMKSLPESIQNLISLWKLTIRDCRGLSCLPNQTGQLFVPFTLEK